MKYGIKYLYGYGLFPLIILLDQGSKHWVSAHLLQGISLPVFPGFSLTLIHNRGAAFGFLADTPVLALWLFSMIAILIGVCLLFWVYRVLHKPWHVIALNCILGGAMGNLIDRLHKGYVVDFLDFYYKNWHFPAFNVADSAITMGVLILCCYMLCTKDT